MEQVVSISQALALLEAGEKLISTSFGGPFTIYLAQGDHIIYGHDHLRAKVTIEKFKEDFHQGVFYHYRENTDHDEIASQEKKWRQ